MLIVLLVTALALQKAMEYLQEDSTIKLECEWADFVVAGEPQHQPPFADFEASLGRETVGEALAKGIDQRKRDPSARCLKVLKRHVKESQNCVKVLKESTSLAHALNAEAYSFYAVVMQSNGTPATQVKAFETLQMRRKTYTRLRTTLKRQLYVLFEVEEALENKQSSTTTAKKAKNENKSSEANAMQLLNPPESEGVWPKEEIVEQQSQTPLQALCAGPVVYNKSSGSEVAQANPGKDD